MQPSNKECASDHCNGRVGFLVTGSETQREVCGNHVVWGIRVVLGNTNDEVRVLQLDPKQKPNLRLVEG